MHVHQRELRHHRAQVDFDACEKCYTSLFEPYGFDRFLQPRPPTVLPNGGAGPARKCVMCPGAPRKNENLAKFQEAAHAGVFSLFTDWARRMAGIPACTRLRTRKDGAWYGWGQYRIRPECWMTFAAGAQLAARAPHRGNMFAGHAMCSMWSPRMRRTWRAACETADESDLLALAGKRQQLYAKTVAVIELKLENVRVGVVMNGYQTPLAAAYHGIASIALL